MLQGDISDEELLALAVAPTHSSACVRTPDLVHYILGPVVYCLVYPDGRPILCVNYEPVDSSGRLAAGMRTHSN